MGNYAHSVAIGPEFFRKAFDDYSNRYWAFAREIMQNSIDCGSRNIDVVVEEDDETGMTRVIVTNDGAVMDDDILVNKLLSLGSSGKDFKAGAVGGFGKAKEILYFAHAAYSIQSGDWIVTGSGAGYDLARNDVYAHGTISDVAWQGLHRGDLATAFLRFIKMCPADSPIRFTLNGDRIRPTIRAGEINRTLDHDGQTWAEVRLSKSEFGRYVARAGGIPMFHGNCDHRGLVVVDLLGTSASKMTSNRDGLKWPYSSQFNDFITAVAVDRSTAFKLEEAVYTKFAGKKLNEKGEGAVPAVEEDDDGAIRVAARVEAPVDMGGAGILVRVNGRTEEPPSCLAHEFIIKNCVRRAVPCEFNPDDLAFSDHAHWLVRAWAGCLVELHELHEDTTLFTVGFVLSEDCLAQWEMSAANGVVYYINPCIVGRKRSTRRWKRASRFDIVASAAHEYVHGGRNESYHGEDFANKLTEIMGTVMKNVKRFNRHLK